MKSFRKTMTIKHTFGALVAMMVAAPVVTLAQGNYNNGNQNDRYGQEPYISIYEDCEFRGERRDVSVGEFRNMRELDFRNDSMSSIRVPKELEAVIFQHDKFKGDYARIDRDVRCFDNTWNDEASSLRVEYTKKRYEQRSNNNRNNERVYGGNNRADTNRSNSHRSNTNRGSDVPRTFNDGVTGKTVSQVVFNNRVLEQVNGRQWQIQSRRRGVAEYVVVRRDESNVYLENQHSSETLRIDLFTNDVTVTKPRGTQQRFAITSRKGRVASAPRTQRQPVVSREPSRRIASSCFDYRAFTSGGQGGVRFHGKDGFHRFDKKATQGRICHNGTLTMEINKTSPSTKAIVEIDGRRFVFAKGEKETSLKNNWYRKAVTLKVGK